MLTVPAVVTANIVPRSKIIVILMMEAVLSSETPILTRGARRKIPEDGILQIKNCLRNYDFFLYIL
jgi:hypothetical protein